MALTCKHGTNNDNIVCGLCSIEESEKMLEELKDRQEHPENHNCKWCGEGLDWLENTAQHLTCLKAYRKGQQWAIDKLVEWCEYNAVEGLEFELKKENTQ